MGVGRGEGGGGGVRWICRIKSGATLFCLVLASLACSLGGVSPCERCSGLGDGQSPWALLENAEDLRDLPARILPHQVVLLVDGTTPARLSLRGGGPAWKKRWYEDDIKDENLRAPHLLRYYLGPTGRRVYTLKKADPQGYPTLPGHPPRLDPSKIDRTNGHPRHTVCVEKISPNPRHAGRTRRCGCCCHPLVVVSFLSALW
jgi:hypothetical protein